MKFYAGKNGLSRGSSALSVRPDGGEIYALLSANSERSRAAQTADAKFYKGLPMRDVIASRQQLDAAAHGRPIA
ncbi:hypothetical protein [uncultured Campylobacter sp.]|uniref:hypothetical protein n=1 Tax=uncultured Campylobacter sp. TaxID=218934 RepID=UPI0028E623EC|nr:hypothetical protein [uncultured Campylobacter sp.]